MQITHLPSHIVTATDVTTAINVGHAVFLLKDELGGDPGGRLNNAGPNLIQEYPKFKALLDQLLKLPLDAQEYLHVGDFKNFVDNVARTPIVQYDESGQRFIYYYKENGRDVDLTVGALYEESSQSRTYYPHSDNFPREWDIPYSWGNVQNVHIPFTPENEAQFNLFIEKILPVLF